ncbi:Mth938-like domain-containing protein, partial [Vreelandella neptunia]|uniref:Mth938-like domain-containing protein n=1 Tax=Vreelandella neptunia TaxID=115551 RepID=UPI0025B5642B
MTQDKPVLANPQMPKRIFQSLPDFGFTNTQLEILRQRLKAAGIGLDAMQTGAAARTYNILAAENRKVAAALRDQNERLAELFREVSEARDVALRAN